MIFVSVTGRINQKGYSSIIESAFLKVSKFQIAATIKQLGKHPLP